ncbi:hypothetical protein Gotur_003723, partial [Gossypium turneri]
VFERAETSSHFRVFHGVVTKLSRCLIIGQNKMPPLIGQHRPSHEDQIHFHDQQATGFIVDLVTSPSKKKSISTSLPPSKPTTTSPKSATPFPNSLSFDDKVKIGSKSTTMSTATSPLCSINITFLVFRSSVV